MAGPHLQETEVQTNRNSKIKQEPEHKTNPKPWNECRKIQNPSWSPLLGHLRVHLWTSTALRVLYDRLQLFIVRRKIRGRKVNLVLLAMLQQTCTASATVEKRKSKFLELQH